MSSELFITGLLVIVGIIVPLFILVSKKQTTYGSKLEEYIVSQNPQNIADVERLHLEYDRRIKEGYL